MKNMYEFIIENTASGKIDKITAVKMLKMLKMDEENNDFDGVAVIGINCVMPNANNVFEFWNNIRNSVCCISEFPYQRRFDISLLVDMGILGNGMEIAYLNSAYLDQIDKFDYNFFGISKKEASLIDPNQRLFLETVWGAIEDAGYGGNMLKNTKTGLFVGYSSDFGYKYIDLIQTVDPTIYGIASTTNVESILAGRISYLLDLKGPSILLNTACSSSLVAVHYACKAIEDGECDMAIAGGVKIQLIPLESRKDQKIGIESSSGRTRTFDASSDGTGFGEGSAAIILKSLKKAVADNDHIYAVIKGSAVNQDGESIGLTAPNPVAQSRLIIDTLEKSKINPETISYVEAHGTGTKLGDPIEVEGITMAFKKFTDKKQFCAIGSIKTNIGHLDHAAGIAGLLKAVMALKHGEIPPTLHFVKPNPNIQFEVSPVYVNDKLAKWVTDSNIKRCGVSSFGLSGTNCHVILEEYLDKSEKCSSTYNLSYIFTLSAKSKQAIEQLIKSYYKFLNQSEDLNIRDICFTSNTGRGHYNYRLALIVGNTDDLAGKLDRLKESELVPTHEDGIFYGEISNKNSGIIDKYECIELTNGYKEDDKDTYTERYEQNRKICEMYINGSDIKWESFYKGEKAKRVSLPAYQFDRSRCWIDISDDRIRALYFEGKGFFHNIAWYRSDLLKEENSFKDENIVLLSRGSSGPNQLVNMLKDNKINILEVVYEAGNNKTEGKYSFEGEYKELDDFIQYMKTAGITKIIHALTTENEKEIEDISSLENCQKIGAINLFQLVKGLVMNGLSKEIEIIILSNNVIEVTGNEQVIYPENATIFGLAKVINIECPRIKCRCIDVEKVTAIQILMNEILFGKEDKLVAFRENVRYLPKLKSVDITAVERRKFEIKYDGVYLITGGSGGLGLEIARFISSKCNVKIILTGRSSIPQRSEWDSIIGSSQDDRLVQKLKEIMAIEKSGTDVDYCQADVSDYYQMKLVINQLKQKHGKIDGILHAAGITEDSLIVNKSQSSFKRVLSPKVAGTWILNELTKDQKLDFFVLFSSISSIAGIGGQCDYVAANYYLDSFAQYLKRKGVNVLSVNWAAWKETGMAFNAGANYDGFFKAIKTCKALFAFDLLLNRKISNAIVGEMNYKSDMVKRGMLYDLKISDELMVLGKEGDKNAIIADQSTILQGVSNVLLSGRQGDDYTELEKKIAGVWGNVLGIYEVNINENFFDMGGNSILAIKMEVEMEKAGLILTTDDLNINNTVAKIAAFLNNKQAGDKFLNTGAVIIENIEPFNDIYFKSCYYNSLFPIFQLYKRDINCILANEIITYQYDDNMEEEIKFNIKYTGIKDEETILKDCGILCILKDQISDVIYEIKNSISVGRPVILWVDCFYESIRTDLFNKEHWPHTILIFGYEDNLSTFDIIEHNYRDNLSYKKCKISYNDIKKSYHGYIENFAHKLRNIPFMELYSESSFDEKNLKENAEKMFSYYADTIVSKKEVLFDNIEYIKRIVSDINMIVKDETRLMGSIDKLVKTLNNIINAKLVERYRMSSLYQQPNDLLTVLNEIISRWESIRSVLVKFMYSSKYRRDSIKNITRVANELSDLESKFINLFINKSPKIKIGSRGVK